MVRRWVVGLGVLMVTVSLALAQDVSLLKTQKDQLSYALGMDLGSQMARQSVDLDPDMFARGLRDALGQGKTLMTDEEARAVIATLQKELVAKQITAATELAAKNGREGAAFLAENGKKPVVVTLPSGLQYTVLETGDGRKPTLEDTVVCHYRGTLIDGKEFDSSYRRAEPATLPVKNLIRGWGEALRLMPVGSKWRLFIPPELAYGERGAGADIGPNATLVFEVELISIKDK